MEAHLVVPWIVSVELKYFEEKRVVHVILEEKILAQYIGT
jgi:hypothetical protein